MNEELQAHAFEIGYPPACISVTDGHRYVFYHRPENKWYLSGHTFSRTVGEHEGRELGRLGLLVLTSHSIEQAWEEGWENGAQFKK